MVSFVPKKRKPKFSFKFRVKMSWKSWWVFSTTTCSVCDLEHLCNKIYLIRLFWQSHHFQFHEKMYVQVSNGNILVIIPIKNHKEINRNQTKSRCIFVPPKRWPFIHIQKRTHNRNFTKTKSLWAFVTEMCSKQIRSVRAI